jgi:two-component system response regulator DevR
MEQRAAASFKVFLVEDSQLLRTRVEGMLAAIPGACMVGHAADADSAIRGILAERPDAVVLDIQLSEGNGFDVLRALRARAPDIRVYVLTNFANEAYRQAAERLGASGFFDKTNEFERLRDALAAVSSARL